MKKLLVIFCLVMSVNSSVVMAEEIRFDSDFRGTKVSETLYALASMANKEIIINYEIDGVTLVSLKNKNIEEALGLLALAHNFSYTIENDVVIVSSPEKLTKLSNLKLEYLDLNYAKKQLETFLPAGKIVTDLASSSITIDGTSEQIKKSHTILKDLDVPTKQILIQVEMVEVSYNKSREIGLSHSWEGYNNMNKTIPLIEYSVVANANEIRSNGKILARPSLTTYSGREAKILIGDEVPVFTTRNTNTSDSTNETTVEYKEVGVSITTTPRVNSKNEISMLLMPKVSSITKWLEDKNTKAPQISTRSAETQVQVKSGETIIIGGLLKEDEFESVSGIPLLSKLPVLGHLFKMTSTKKEKVELFIFVTPTVLNEEESTIKTQEPPLQENIIVENMDMEVNMNETSTQ